MVQLNKYETAPNIIQLNLTSDCLLISVYRVFKLDMTYFEVQDGHLKLTWPSKVDFHVQEKVAAHSGGWDI